MAVNSTMAPTPFFRAENSYTELEKRQLFLRSYQFSRKQSVAEKIKKSLFRVKRVIWVRLRSAGKLRRLVWLKLKNGFLLSSRRRRVFVRINGTCGSSSTGYNNHYYRRFSNGGGGASGSESSCFW